MVQALDCLTETALSQELEDFEPVAKMILQNDLVVTLFVIVAVIENIHLLQSLLVPLNVLWRLA